MTSTMTGCWDSFMICWSSSADNFAGNSMCAGV
jgi:hypothetical protein